MARLPLPPAETLKLHSLAELASGGMGTIDVARAEGGRHDGKLFAVKRLHDKYAKDPQFVAMFLDEAWMTAAMKSPNVVQVAAWGTDEKGMFLAVELVEGVSLHGLLQATLKREEQFSERAVAFIGSEICGGLASAHELRGTDGSLLGLVHRDLTLGNVLVSFKGEVKIADFGIAKARARISHTETGMLKGKPGYMAPEQARGQEVDHRADIFSFGVVMFELLAGRRPWSAPSAIELMLAAASEPPEDLTALRRGCDRTLVAIINKCLEKEPEKRFSSATVIKGLLDEWRASRGFIGGERDMLAKFVQRSCVPQMQWFKHALSGDVLRSAATSFKELEEQLSREGAPSGRASAARISAFPTPSTPIGSGERPRASAGGGASAGGAGAVSGVVPGAASGEEKAATGTGASPPAPAVTKDARPSRFSFVARWATAAEPKVQDAPPTTEMPRPALPSPQKKEEPPKVAVAMPTPAAKASSTTLKSREVIPELMRSIGNAQAQSPRPAKKPPPTVKVTAPPPDVESPKTPAPSDKGDPKTPLPTPAPKGPKAPSPTVVSGDEAREAREAREALKALVAGAPEAPEANAPATPRDGSIAPPVLPPPPVPSDLEGPAPAPKEVAAAALVPPADAVVIAEKPLDDEVDSGPQPTMKSPPITASNAPPPMPPVDVQVSTPRPLPPPEPKIEARDGRAGKRQLGPGHTRMRGGLVKSPKDPSGAVTKPALTRPTALLALIALFAGAIIAWILRSRM
jgi:serine/threonine-protein kinase